MLRVVNDSLDLARIEAGKLAPEIEPFDPAELVREVATLERPLAERKGLAFDVVVAPEVPAWVSGDALRTKQILLNLANNAFKFTERDGVTLGAARAVPGVLCFSIVDSGPGMSDTLRTRLSSRFEQADGSARQHGGSGLGLAICREPAQLMGGSIEVASTLGVGSTFNVMLPLAEVAVGESTAAIAERASASNRGLQVLLVEDDLTVAKIIAGLLEQLGHHVVHELNDVAMLTALKARGKPPDGIVAPPFNVALVDLDLPGIDGLQLARTIRAIGYVTLPLIAVTARSVGDEDAQIRAAGMDALLRKLLTSALLGRAIDSVRTSHIGRLMGDAWAFSEAAVAGFTRSHRQLGDVATGLPCSDRRIYSRSTGGVPGTARRSELNSIKKHLRVAHR